MRPRGELAEDPNRPPPVAVIGETNSPALVVGVAGGEESEGLIALGLMAGVRELPLAAAGVAGAIGLEAEGAR